MDTVDGGTHWNASQARLASLARPALASHREPGMAHKIKNGFLQNSASATM